MIDKVDGKRIGSDNNKYLIALFKHIQSGGSLPDYIEKDEYLNVRENKKRFPDWFVGWVGFNCSVNGKFFNGFSGICNTKQGIRNYQTEKKNSILKQIKNLKEVEFIYCEYNSLEYPKESLIYCDPPYENTTGYKCDFNHDKFWQWCRNMTSDGHKIFVSEYNAPSDFICVWEKKVINSMNTTKTYKPIEKLFTL